jgi:hypothetical protein
MHVKNLPALRCRVERLPRGNQVGDFAIAASAAS